ncbi:hypothetical protein [Parasitella parasitica]|uniref:Mitochondrial distribution and morphology protein 34 n=1 Tax=Parasitella parasitica TaxID=35722 RepID=A0A0B7N8E0_9FUNG|nr:hypothetical protein [Parasitella parasitica]
MAFRFNWPEFDHEFYVEAKQQLETAMNKGNKPSVIVDHITVKELHMGTQPPELEILEIGELGNDKFRGIFKLNYAGDAYIEVQTKVQANPMHAKVSELPRHSRPSILAADQSLVVPMILRISDLKLRGIVVLVVSKTKGVTLVFKNDPLESIRVSSTFDSVSILRDFLQRQIEAQLRNLLQEDLPAMIHNLSLRYIQSEEEKKKQKEQLERRQKLLQQQQNQETLSISSEPLLPLRRAFSSWSMASTPLTAPLMRARSSTCYSDDLTLPELDANYPLTPTSLSSSLYTPLTGTFDLNDEYSSYDDYLVATPTTPATTMMSTVFGSGLNAAFSKSNTTFDLTGGCRTAPMTVANLFTHNRQYNNGKTNQLGISPLFHKDYHPMAAMMYAAQQQDTLSETSLSTPSMADIYCEADAPWYAVEGPEIGPSHIIPSETNFMDDKAIILRPSENNMALKLSMLTSVNYTLSPLTESISNFTFRSLPHVRKSNSTMSRSKKVPKRRITRLNMSAPPL